jgi:hypothetical protein
MQTQTPAFAWTVKAVIHSFWQRRKALPASKWHPRVMKRRPEESMTLRSGRSQVEKCRRRGWHRLMLLPGSNYPVR